MDFAHLLEAGMLVCFGFSWPLNVIKAYKARTAKGSSLAFIILIITGYVAGIAAKIINNQINYVLAVYFLNLAIVMLNVFVYIRNKALDRKAAEGNGSVKISTIQKTVKSIKSADVSASVNIEETSKEAQEENMLNYSNSLDDLINRPEVYAERKNAVILMGSGMDKEIPVASLAKEYDFNFDLLNKSEENLTLSNAASYYENKVSSLSPEGILLHLGAEDVEMFKKDSSVFDSCYLNLLEKIRSENKNCRLALVSVNNPSNEKTLTMLNAHIKAIAQAEQAAYVNLENAKLWNPEAAKASSDFAYSMGLRIRRPLKDVAEILYSYAYRNLESDAAETLVG